MKLLNKAYLLFSWLAVGLAHLHGTSIDFLLQNTAEKTIPFYFNSANHEDPLHLQANPDKLLYCPEITIENIGNEPIFNCFPYINSQSLYSFSNLQKALANSETPILTLFNLWKSSIVIADQTSDDVSPLDLLNNYGSCSQTDFEQMFLKFCQGLGFEIRLANIHGKTIYDFSYRPGYWSLLDIITGQFYFGFNNKTLVSSEELMDDPFLIFRNHANLSDGWKELSRFDILNPVSAPILTFDVDPLEEKVNGFDLYPNDSLVFKTTSNKINHTQFQRVVEHKLDCHGREFESLTLQYQSPVPISKIENCTKSSVTINKNIHLAPADSYWIIDSQSCKFDIEFNQEPVGHLNFEGTFGWNHYPVLKIGQNQFNIGTENKSTIKVHYEINEDFSTEAPSCPSLIVQGQSYYDHEAPSFTFQTIQEPEKIWWQISQDPDFQIISNHLNRTDAFSEKVTLNDLEETFLNANENYYFRAKGCFNDQWSEWSSVHTFAVNKPLNIEIIDFDKIDSKTYELNWERFEGANDDVIEYLVFGSNSIDFIPSIYCEKQINAFSNDEAVEEINDNFIAITKEPKFQIEKQEACAYYRVIVKKNNQLSIPSPIIHFYDHDLNLPRNALQCTRSDAGHLAAKRTLFPYQGSMTELSILHALPPAPVANLNTIIQSHINSGKVFADPQLIVKPCPSHIDQEAWKAVQPWLIPENHPCKAKLDRLAFQKRFILNSRVMKQCGFPRAERVGRWSRVCASSHRDMQDYYFKIYHDSEIHIKYDWKRWIHRCEGAKLIRDCIKKNNLQSHFKVPKKWIYALPENGQKPPVSPKYVEKNFILVCDNMRICEHKENEKLYKKKIDKARLKGLYIILQECGLYDSVYCFNMPFNKDGYICFVDTEYWHKWPVPFDRLTHSFSKELRPYWNQLSRSKKIPDGVNSPNNLPRQDRRDH